MARDLSAGLSAIGDVYAPQPSVVEPDNTLTSIEENGSDEVAENHAPLERERIYWILSEAAPTGQSALALARKPV